MKPSKLLGPCAGLVLLLGLGGCGSDGTSLLNAPNTFTEVQAGALAISVAAPASDAAGDMIADMMDLIPGQPAAPLTGNGATSEMIGSSRQSPGLTGTRGIAPSTCPPAFDLGNGITGTCSTDSLSGVVTFSFGGSSLVGGMSFTVSGGSMVATPSVPQPATGDAYDIVFAATVSTPVGDVDVDCANSWMTRDDMGQVTDFAFNMDHVVSPYVGSQANVSTVVTPSLFELTMVAPLGGTLTFVLDRTTMTGAVFLGSVEVASVNVSGGCVDVDFLGLGLTDEIFCPDVPT